MSEEKSDISNSSEDENTDEGENTNEEIFSSENDEDDNESDDDDFAADINTMQNLLLMNLPDAFRELIEMELRTRTAEETHLNPEEIASLAPPEEAEYLGHFNEEEETIKIDLNKRYTLPSCLYFDRRIIVFPGTEIPLIIRHPEEINSIYIYNIIIVISYKSKYGSL